jgi:hypothetical protein
MAEAAFERCIHQIGRPPSRYLVSTLPLVAGSQSLAPPQLDSGKLRNYAGG